MSAAQHRTLLGLTILFFGLCACTSRAAPRHQPPAAPEVTSQAPPALALRLHARQARAAELMRRGDLAAALIQWEILLTLAPGNTAFSQQRQRTQALMQHHVATSLHIGEQAWQHGDIQRAKQAFLRVLALDPSQSRPSLFLRAMEQHERKEAQRTKLRKLKSVRQRNLPTRSPSSPGHRGGPGLPGPPRAGHDTLQEIAKPAADYSRDISGSHVWPPR